MYKAQHTRDQEQMKEIISQKQSLSQPQLQIVYPIVNPNEHQQHTQWRRQQQRRVSQLSGTCFRLWILGGILKCSSVWQTESHRLPLLRIIQILAFSLQNRPFAGYSHVTVTGWLKNI